MKEFLHVFSWAEIEEWTNHAKPFLHVVLILAIAWLALRLSQRGIALFRLYMGTRSLDGEDTKRVETLARVFGYIATVVISVVAGMLMLSVFGISIAPILAAAGAVGIAVGFGAQNLIKDYFNGLFILLENQVRQGDVAELGGKSGMVEEVTLRYIRLRGYEGNVHFVPNGTITTVTNMSRGYSYAVIDASVAYRENVDEVFELMRKTGAELRQDGQFGPKILEDLELAGVDNWADSAVVIRCRIKVRPLEQWNVKREFLRRLKQTFDANGIEIPYPHLTIYPGQGKDGSAPPLRVVAQESVLNLPEPAQEKKK
ncbi:MAG: mechanosensitive ion channel family protein [Sulfuricella sp.]|nr:mechanosensitive ion channel family protein [Sulfuricella sp.]